MSDDPPSEDRLARLLGPTSVRPLPNLPRDEGSHFWDYWGVVVRRRWTVVMVFLVVVVGTILGISTMRPIFMATATIRIDREEPRVLKFEEVLRSDPVDYLQTQYQNQIKMLQTRSLARRVVGLLQLEQYPEFRSDAVERGWWQIARTRVWETLSGWIEGPPAPVAQGGTDLTVESPLTSAFQSHLTVTPVRNARLVRVSFESRHPELAARAANTLVEAFIAQQLDHKVEASRYATQFLARQMEEARAKLETSEEKLSRFLEQNNIVLVTGEKSGERQDLATQQLAALSDALLRARAVRTSKESLYAEAIRQEGSASPAVLQSQLVTRLKEELGALEGKYRELAQTFKPEYPRMQRTVEKIAELKRQLSAETARIVEGLEADYRAAARDEQELEKAVAAQGEVARRLGERMAQYQVLRRDIETSRELYTALLTRLKETQISSALLTSNVTIVDPAEVPLVPAKPPRTWYLLIASAIGLCGGIGLAFLLEYLDTKVRDAEEIEGVLRVPTLGLVPARTAVEGRRLMRALGRPKEATPFALVTHHEADSPLAEAFRDLRTNLLSWNAEVLPTSLMITSIGPRDGKTSLATNLAIALAQLGAGEIVLVDADMRRPSLHEILAVPREPGLSTFLGGQAELPAVAKATTVPNLYVVPAGSLPVNPTELLVSPRMAQALTALRERSAHVVFDAPPLFGTNDAKVLAPRVDGVVLVLRQGRASRDAAYRATQVLASLRARLLGVVLNDVTAHSARTYGYYGYGEGGRHATP